MRTLNRARDRFDTWRARKTDAAYFEGVEHTAAEYDVTLEDKDAFIAEQSAIIEQCMAVFDDLQVWDKVPDSLRERLRSYV